MPPKIDAFSQLGTGFRPSFPADRQARPIRLSRIGKSRHPGIRFRRPANDAAPDGSSMADFDLAIIGGGINGAGIARDAAGRGIRVLLVEQNDLASATSSASTKLIHGGLRYLEQGAFRLVREALAEREVLLRNAPHLIRPLRFVLPHHDALRPAWQLRAGLFLYDRLGGRAILPGTKVLDLTHGEVAVPLKRRYKLGFEYSDCRADDSRLVLLNAVDAAERGAVIRTRTRLARADREDLVWRLALKSRGRREIVTARVLVNATGPWVAVVAQQILRRETSIPVRLVKGSHIVVPKLFPHDRAYIFQSGDGRVVFAIPYEGEFTLIGTTEEDYDGDPGAVAASSDEITYLCRTANDYFRESIAPEDVVWAYAGVRPLHGDRTAAPKDISRDYLLALDAPHREAPLLTVYGGKITTYRRLAEAAVDKIANFFIPAPAWTAGAPLPGGNFPWNGLEALLARTRGLWPFLTEAHARRLVAAYGTRIDRILGRAMRAEDLGPWFGTELTGAEVRHLMRSEWAERAEDVLWRRSKLGLRLDAEQRQALERFMADARVVETAAE
jgi:glycerol-3-phosphate dehydrogenase